SLKHALFQLHKSPLKNGDDFRIETLPRFGGDSAQGFRQWQRAAIGPVRRQGVQAIHGRKYPRSNGDLLAGKATRIPASIPFLMVSAHDGEYGFREVHAR